MDAAPKSATRSGRAYYKAAGMYLTPIACPPSFNITPLLRAAFDAELDAMPDVPLDSSPVPNYDARCPLHTDAARADADPCAPICPAPFLLPFASPQPPPATHCATKRTAQALDDEHDDARPTKRLRMAPSSEASPAVSGLAGPSTLSQQVASPGSPTPAVSTLVGPSPLPQQRKRPRGGVNDGGGGGINAPGVPDTPPPTAGQPYGR